jgi:hypothetical protein
MEAGMKVARAFLAAALVALAAATSAGCGGAPNRSTVTAPRAEAHWQDIFETTPEVFAVLHPKDLGGDKVFGPLLRRALDVARDRSRLVAATRILEVMQNADEVIFGVRPSEREGDEPSEEVIVIRGVPGSADPAKIVDADGHPLWTPGPMGAVRELVRDRDEHGHPIAASLFEMEGLTWVIATSDARARAREVFAHPLGRPEMTLGQGALAMIRIDGPSLVKRIRALQPLGGLAAVGRKLGSLTVTLPPGSEENVQLTLAYDDEDAAAFSQVAVQQAIEVIGRKRPENLAWMASAKVDRPDKRVLLSLPLPPRLIDGLLKAGSAPIDFDPSRP